MSSPKPKSSQESVSSHQQNMRLMEQMGASSYDPMPPDQHGWLLKQPYVSNEMRLWSLMLRSTVAFAPGRPRSPYAVDENGEELHIQHMARILDEHESNTRKSWNRLEARGLVRKGTPSEGKKRLYLCGKVCEINNLDEFLAGLGVSQESPQMGVPESPQMGVPNSIILQISPYLRRHVERLPDEQKQAFWERWKDKEDREKRIVADVMMAARELIEQEEDSIFSEFQIPKIRQEQIHDVKRAAEKTERKKRLQPLVQSLKDFVQTSFAFTEKESAQCTESGSVHTFYPYVEEKIQRKENYTHTDESVQTAGDGVCVPPDSVSVPPESPPQEVAVRFDPEPAWNVFWNRYPTKSGENEVRQWWTKHVKSREYACEIIEGLNRHLQSDRWNRNIGIPDPINFLRKHAYKDRPKPQPPPAMTKRETDEQQLKEFARRMDEHIRKGGKP